jgi:hypothetical protein
MYSPKAAAFASFSMYTGLPSRRSESIFCMGVFKNGRLLAYSIMPVALFTVPGEPRPTQGTSLSVAPAFSRACLAVAAIASAICSAFSVAVEELTLATILQSSSTTPTAILVPPRSIPR